MAQACSLVAARSAVTFMLVAVRAADTQRPFANYSIHDTKGLPTFRYRLFPQFEIPGGLYLYGLIASLWIRIKQSPDVVYSRFGFGSWLCHKLGIQTVFEFHSDKWNSDSVEGRLMRHMLKRGMLKGAVCISDALKAQLLADFPNTTTPVLVEHDAAYALPEDQLQAVTLKGDTQFFHVGYTGSLYPGKGIALLRDLTKLLTPEDRIAIHIVGGRDAEVKQWKREMNGEFVHFYGSQPAASIPAFISAFDVCLLPNQQSVQTGQSARDIGRFTSPLKMFEYMARQKAIIASDLPVLREVLNEGNAQLVSPTDPEQWKSAILELMLNDPKASSLAKQAYRDWQAYYTWEKRADRIVNWLSDRTR